MPRMSGIDDELRTSLAFLNHTSRSYITDGSRKLEARQISESRCFINPCEFSRSPRVFDLTIHSETMAAANDNALSLQAITDMRQTAMGGDVPNLPWAGVEALSGNWAADRRVGEGGFGDVFQGLLLRLINELTGAAISIYVRPLHCIFFSFGLSAGSFWDPNARAFCACGRQAPA